MHESKFPFVSRIEFIRSKLSNFSAHVCGVSDIRPAAPHSTHPFSGSTQTNCPAQYSPVLRVDADGPRLRQSLGDEGAGEAAVSVGDADRRRAAVRPVQVTRHPVHGQVVRTVRARVKRLAGRRGEGGGGRSDRRRLCLFINLFIRFGKSRKARACQAKLRIINSASARDPPGSDICTELCCGTRDHPINHLISHTDNPSSIHCPPHAARGCMTPVIDWAPASPRCTYHPKLFACLRRMFRRPWRGSRRSVRCAKRQRRRRGDPPPHGARVTRHAGARGGRRSRSRRSSRRERGRDVSRRADADDTGMSESAPLVSPANRAGNAECCRIMRLVADCD